MKKYFKKGDYVKRLAGSSEKTMVMDQIYIVTNDQNNGSDLYVEDISGNPIRNPGRDNKSWSPDYFELYTGNPYAIPGKLETYTIFNHG